MKTKLTALSFAVLAGLSTACGAAPHADVAPAAQTETRAPAAQTETRAPAAQTEIRAPGEARIGDRTTCPVSHEEFLVSATSPRAEYAGKTYYFCCADCAQKFEAEPARFLK